MSSQTLHKTITCELQKLNDIIDMKIIKGLSYEKEARRHKFLRSRLSELPTRGQSQPHWFFRTFSTVSSFIL